jgi:hypothetical protein
MGIAYNTSIVTDGLVFNLDAANVRSYSGSGNTSYSLFNNFTMSLNNGVGFTSTGRGMFVFDGANDSITSTDYNIPYDNNAEFTIEVVCKFNSNPNSYQTVFLYGSGNQNQGLILSKARSGYGNGWVYGGVISNGIGIFANTTLNGDQIVALGLVHYTITFSKPSSVFVARMYINGDLNNTNTTAISTYTISGLNFFGLSSGGSFSEPVNGNIALFKFYNRALSAAEVKQNYNALRDRFGI